jgi:hypothetical protein
MLKSSITTSSPSSIQHVPSVSPKRRAVTFREQQLPAAPRTHRARHACTAVAADGDDDNNNDDAATADLRFLFVDNNHHHEDEDEDDDDDYYYRKEKWNPNNYSNPMYNDNYDDDDDDDVSLQLDDIFPQVTTCRYRGGAVCTAPTARIHLLHGTRNLNFEFELDDDDDNDNDDDDENDWTPSESSSLSYTSIENTTVDGTTAAATTITTTFDTTIHHNESTFPQWENETSLSSLLEEHLHLSLHDVNLPNKLSTTTTTKQPSQLSIHELSTTTVENTSFQSLADDGVW